jgi:hypothetical protein
MKFLFAFKIHNFFSRQDFVEPEVKNIFFCNSLENPVCKPIIGHAESKYHPNWMVFLMKKFELNSPVKISIQIGLYFDSTVLVPEEINTEIHILKQSLSFQNALYSSQQLF